MKIASVALFIILLTGLLGWLNNQPQNVGADVPQGKLNSLSFAPFREGQSPIEAVFPTPEQIAEDLRLMAEKTHSIRTYASAEGTMPVIPELARKYGLKMIQGAWLGYVDADNNKEIKELIRAANAYPDVITRVIVGNEVLLRGEREADEIIKYIREVKQAVKQPVSYADVWSMYMKNPQLIKEVDFITIHILPYWEDEPIAAEQAPAHIERIYKLVQQQIDAIAPGKSILIGESGWPSAGRQRGWAVPSVVNEARFIRDLMGVARANNFDYNIVEAINQSWKSELEGVVGGNWGLFSIDREEVFPLTGQVYENQHWYKGIMASCLIFLIGISYYWQSLRALSTPRLITWLVFLQLLSVLFVSQIEILWNTSYNDWQRLQTVVLIGLNAALAGLMLQRSKRLLTNQAPQPMLDLWLYRLYLVFVGYAIYKTYGLATYGRYISFPLVATYIPVIGIIGLSAVTWVVNQHISLKTLSVDSLFGVKNSQEKWHKPLGYALIIMIFAMIIGETKAFTDGSDFILAYPAVIDRIRQALIFTVSNGQLLSWLIYLAILAVPLLVANKTRATH
jgi:exo-beta-1,3-glucanase (GH17 family)